MKRRETVGVPDVDAIARVCFVIVLLGILMFCGPLAAQHQEQEYVPGELIVKFEKTATAVGREHALNAVKAKHIRTFRLTGAQHVHLGAGVSVEKALEILTNPPFRGTIEYAEPNYIYHAISGVPTPPMDALRANLWAMHNIGQTGGTGDADIDALEAWRVTTGSNEIIVGGIDSGIDYLHEDLDANIWINPIESLGAFATDGIDNDGNGYIDDVRGWDFVNNDNDPMDDNGHGTHTAGTIGAEGNNGVGVVGVNWTVKIMPLKFLNAGGSGTTDAAIAAIEYAAWFGVRITNNSWGGGRRSRALENAIRDAGALFVAAAGNSGCDCKMYPAAHALDNIISVAATDHNDALASFSNYGTNWVDLAAPGVNILSTLPGNSYGSYQGTSMAAPHVAGVAALVLAENPGFSNAQIKDRILVTVDVLPSLSGIVAAGGRLNAGSAVGASALPADITPPAAVGSLVASSPTERTITLSWTATGDDGSTGTAYTYDLRYLVGTTPIDNSTWSSATVVAGLPIPKTSGQAESFVVSGLQPGTDYAFALKVLDELGNSSDLTGTVSATVGVFWIAENVDSQGNLGFYNSHAYDASGNPAIGYSDSPNDDVKFALWNGSGWDLETVDAGTDVYTGIDLAYDGAGHPALSYGWGKLCFARKTANGWSNTVIESKKANNDVTSLAYDPTTGGAVIAYRLIGNPARTSGLKLAMQDPISGLWSTEIVDPDGDAARYNAMAFDGNGFPAIAYSADPDRDGWLSALNFAEWNASTSSWDITTVETGVVGYGVFVTLAFDDEGMPMIVHGNAGEVRFCYRDGSGWHTDIVDNAHPYYGGYSLALSSSGSVYLALVVRDGSNVLEFAKRGVGGVWSGEFVDGDRIGNFRTKLRFNGLDVPSISYRGADYDVMFAQRQAAVPLVTPVPLFSKMQHSDDPNEMDAAAWAALAQSFNAVNPGVSARDQYAAIMDATPAGRTHGIDGTAAFILHQNFPNPFNPATTITFELREEGVVQLRVFDVLGREVADLVKEGKQAGKYCVGFDARALPSGVYFYSLELNGYVQTGSMLLLK